MVGTKLGRWISLTPAARNIGWLRHMLSPDRQYTEVAAWGASAPSASFATGSFAAPMGIALDGSGHVYVVDAYNNRIQKLDSHGNFIMSFGASAPNASNATGSFNAPAGIAIDRSGHIYVTEAGSNRVQKFDSSGNFIRQFGASAPIASSAPGSFDTPVDIAFDNEGYMYVADFNNNRVQKLNSNGAFIMQYGASAPNASSALGSFNASAGLALDGNGNLYVAEAGNNRIQKLDTNGNFMTYLGNSAPNASSAHGLFNFPLGIAIDENQNLLVADTGNNLVLAFDANGSFIAAIGVSVPNAGQAISAFVQPIRLAVDGTGQVFVSDLGNNRVVVYKGPTPPSPPLHPPPPSPQLSQPSPPPKWQTSPPTPSPQLSPHSQPSPNLAASPPPPAMHAAVWSTHIKVSHSLCYTYSLQWQRLVSQQSQI